MAGILYLCAEEGEGDTKTRSNRETPKDGKHTTGCVDQKRKKKPLLPNRKGDNIHKRQRGKEYKGGDTKRQRERERTQRDREKENQPVKVVLDGPNVDHLPRGRHFCSLTLPVFHFFVP